MYSHLPKYAATNICCQARPFYKADSSVEAFEYSLTIIVGGLCTIFVLARQSARPFRFLLNVADFKLKH